MKGNTLLIGMICLVIAACLIIYLVSPSPKPETVSDNAQVSKETAKTDKPNNQLPDKTAQQEKLADTTQEKSNTEKQDWLKEPTLEELAKQFSDPRKDFEFTDDLPGDEIETNQVDITDPASYDALRNEMVKQYGETTEVENYMETWLKVVSNPGNVEYKAEFAKAVYAIFPHPATKKSMEILNAIVNNDLETLQRYYEPTQEDSRFLDVQRFFEGNSNHADAFRNLRKFDPKRSAEFEKFILEEARRDPSIDFEKVSRDIEASYKNEVNKNETINTD